MRFDLEGRCVITFDHKEGDKTSKHIATDFSLEVSPTIDRSIFIDKDEIPTIAGAKALTQCFIQGLIGNISFCNEKGIWDISEHLNYIVEELEKSNIQLHISKTK